MYNDKIRNVKETSFASFFEELPQVNSQNVPEIKLLRDTWGKEVWAKSCDESE
jgi:hypothetical protein